MSGSLTKGNSIYREMHLGRAQEFFLWIKLRRGFVWLNLRCWQSSNARRLSRGLKLYFMTAKPFVGPSSVEDYKRPWVIHSWAKQVMKGRWKIAFGNTHAWYKGIVQESQSFYEFIHQFLIEWVIEHEDDQSVDTLWNQRLVDSQQIWLRFRRPSNAHSKVPPRIWTKVVVGCIMCSPSSAPTEVIHACPLY